MANSNWTALLLHLIVVCQSLHAQGQIRKSPKRIKAPVVCPDTCALKRRIGKLEIRFENDVTEVKTACLAEVNALRDRLDNRNLTIVQKTNTRPMLDVLTLTSLRKNITKSVATDMDKVIADLKGEFLEGQGAITRAFDEVKRLSTSVSSTLYDDALRDSRQREVDLRSTIDLMNRTMHSLQVQNINLQRQTQAIRSQSAVLRAQNDIISEDNKELRKLMQGQRASTDQEERIEEIEDSLSHQVSSMNALQQNLEWLTDRVNALSEGVDAAAFEAASASETALRAETLSNKAISVARGRPVSEQQGTGSTESDEFSQPETPPTDCSELYQMGYNKSGVYRIKPWRSSQTFEVFCEQTYNGGGWTLIQRRRDGSVDFDKSWSSYSEGFGEFDGEMWLGNEKIHAITNQDSYTLQVLLLDWENNRAYAEYEGFRVQNNADYYSLRFGRFTHGTAGDGFRGTAEDGSRNLYLARFTTSDIDNDSCRPCIVDSNPFENCADQQGGGWWFRACADSNLNGRYIQQRDLNNCRGLCNGIQWRTWHDEERYSLKATIMLIRPVSRE